MVKHAITQITGVLAMHIVTLAARKGILLQCISAPREKSSSTQVRKKPSWQKLKINRVHGDKETTETESSIVRSTQSITLEGIPMIQSMSKC